jgi:hypothetical protein
MSNTAKEIYLTPKEIKQELSNVTAAMLKYYRLKGDLKKVKWAVGKGKPYYEINEVKKLFHKN